MKSILARSSILTPHKTILKKRRFKCAKCGTGEPPSDAGCDNCVRLQALYDHNIMALRTALYPYWMRWTQSAYGDIKEVSA